MSSSAGTAAGSLSSPPTCGSGDAGGGPVVEEDCGPFEEDELPCAGSGSTDADSTGALTRTVLSLSVGTSAGGGKGGGKAVASGCGFLSGLRTQSSLYVCARCLPRQAGQELPGLIFSLQSPINE